MMPRSPLPAAPATDGRPRPLTNPADLFALLGRFVACLVMYGFTLTYAIQGRLPQVLLFGAGGLLLQFTSIRLWRRLRKERAEAEAALLAQAPPTEEAA